MNKNRGHNNFLSDSFAAPLQRRMMYMSPEPIRPTAVKEAERMNPNLNPAMRPDADLSAHANLDIHLEDWQGTAAVGLIGVTVVAVVALILGARR